MSYDENDAAADAFYEQVGDEAINEFTADRLKSFYDNHTDVMQPALRALNEGTDLLKLGRDSASLVFSASAIELLLKATILKPLVYGLVHNDGLAELIVTHTLGGTGFLQYRPLLVRFFKEIGDIDVGNIRRPVQGKLLIEECRDIAEARNRILHQGETITPGHAERASAVATATYLMFVEPMLTALGLYIFNDGIISRSTARTVKRPDEVSVLAEPLMRMDDGTYLGTAILATGTVPVPPAGTPRP